MGDKMINEEKCVVMHFSTRNASSSTTTYMAESYWSEIAIEI